MTLNTVTDKSPRTQKWFACNGLQLQKLTQAAMVWLEKNHQRVNELNVFPVPDGDTGTNMLLTMRSAYSRIRNSEETHVGKVADELARGALMGARGNSGVILSQIWRGLAKGLQDKDTFTVQDLADAMEQAADTAYGGVMRPVEGTILTVIREAAEEAQDAAGKSQDLRFFLERVLERGQQTLERTPELLPVLKQAGVVDSGGQGLVYILEGMLLYVHGRMEGVQELSSPAQIVADLPAQAHAMPEGGVLEFPYDVQFILTGNDLNVDQVRQRIDSMGDSTVVVGDDRTIKVHIHVKDPGEPLSYGISVGHVTDVVVENMQMQMEDIVHAPQTAVSPPEPPPVTVEPGQIGVVAVAAGKGLSDIFRSLGAASVVNGGQTNNPSTEEIFQAIQDVPTDKIIILPNNKNIVLASEAARDLSPKQVAVVPSRTIPQGFSAMVCHNPNGDLEESAAAMQEAIDYVATGEITRATRSVTLDGVRVEKGQLIGLLNGRLQASGSDVTQVIQDVLGGMDMEDRELVSLYYGQDIEHEEAETVGQQIATTYDHVEVEVLPGGQAHYFYIIGAE